MSGADRVLHCISCFFGALWAGPGAFCLALAVLIPLPGVAQLLQGTIDGNVTDSSHAAIVNASITTREQGTGFTRNAETNTQGEFTLATLPPGSYTITARAQGFQTYTKTGIIVNANNVTRTDIALTIGELTQKVLVSAQPSALQTDRADVHTNLNAQSLTELPSPLGRNYQMILSVVVPGVSTPQGGGSVGANPTRSVGFSVNGAGGITNDTRIDGTSAVDFNRDVPMYTPALDAIQNVNVVTNSFDAEQG
ncbi:MAG: carboxypeptidase-like regulatory domain-containing protein, partial [Acidobacteriaceae bacterium]